MPRSADSSAKRARCCGGPTADLGGRVDSHGCHARHDAHSAAASTCSTVSLVDVLISNLDVDSIRWDPTGAATGSKEISLVSHYLHLPEWLIFCGPCRGRTYCPLIKS